MIALLKREFYIFKHNLIPYICIWTLLPMSIYLFISIPLSNYIRADIINYLHWSSIGNVISASSVFVYIVSLNSILKYKYATNFSNMMLSSNSSFIRTFVTSILAIFLLFGSGLFIPLEGAPAFFHYSPLYYTILNIQNIITRDSSIIYPSIIVLIISVIIFIVNLIISHKVFRT